MLKWLHELLERWALRIYRNGAQQLGAEYVRRHNVDITSVPAVLSKLIEAVDDLYANQATRFAWAASMQRSATRISTADQKMLKFACSMDAVK